MGQAKQRGSKEDRILQVKAKLDAIRPSTLTCNSCQAEITEIKDGNTRGMPGIDGIFLGKCPKCGNITQAVVGTKDAVAAYSKFMDEYTKSQSHTHSHALPRMSIQSKRGEIATATPSEDTVREAFKIPESATLLGYVVFLPEEAEYLAFVKKDANGNTERGYAASPHNAQVFPSYVKAQKASSLLIRQSEVGFLFDQEDQFAVYSPSRLH
jgi:transcription elongation factor Elf1